MKDFATKYLNWYNGLSKVVKAVLCLLWDVPTCLERFSRSALKDDVLGMVLAVVVCLFGGWILFLVDLITILAMDKIFWMSDLGVENVTAKLDEALKSDGAEEAEAKTEEPAAPAEEPAAPAEEAAEEKKDGEAE